MNRTPAIRAILVSALIGLLASTTPAGASAATSTAVTHITITPTTGSFTVSFAPPARSVATSRVRYFVLVHPAAGGPISWSCVIGPGAWSARRQSCHVSGPLVHTVSYVVTVLVNGRSDGTPLSTTRVPGVFHPGLLGAPINLVEQFSSGASIFRWYAPKPGIPYLDGVGFTVTATDQTNPAAPAQVCNDPGTDGREQCTLSTLRLGDRYSFVVVDRLLRGVRSQESVSSAPSAPFLAGERFGLGSVCDPSTCVEPDVADFPLYGNFSLKDGSFAAAADLVIVAHGVTPLSADIAADYVSVTGGQDIGVSPQQLADFWKTNPIGGYVAPSFTLIASDEASIEAAVRANKALWVAFFIPAGSVLIGDRGLLVAVGHAAVLDGFSPVGPLLATWGTTLKITWAEWAAWSPSAYVVTTTLGA